jgi:hypothetical protein
VVDEEDVEMRLARQRDALWTILLRARLSRISRRQPTPEEEAGVERGRTGKVVPFVRPPRRG